MKPTTKQLLTNTLLCSLMLFNQPAMAQGDWFEKAKKMLGLGEEKVQLSDEDIAKGLKQTLSVATESVVAKLGRQSGFGGNPDLRIKLPESLQGVRQALDKVGMGQWATKLEDKLNQAAEAAVPKAAPVLLDAIKNMSLKDVQDIYQGENNAATNYFKQTMSTPIQEAITPVITQSLAQVGAVKSYEQLMEKYQAIPFLPKVNVDLASLVEAKTMTAIFEQLGKEEAAIRQNPVKQTTALLKQLFSSN
jgi:hypothetical protein